MGAGLDKWFTGAKQNFTSMFLKILKQDRAASARECHVEFGINTH